jgi:hypothetical protein
VELAPVSGDLPLQVLHDLVDGGFDVPTVGVGPEGPAGAGAGHFDPVTSFHAGAPLLHELDLHAGELGEEPFDLSKLVLGGAAELVRDAKASGLEDEVHERLTLPFCPTTGAADGLPPG